MLDVGKQLGLQGEGLRKWVEEQQARERKEKDLEREERAVERVALRERAEIEERTLQLRIRLAESGASATAVTDSNGNGGERVSSSSLCPRKLIPPFDDRRDDLDAYLKRFECIARGEEWPLPKWATALSMCLTGEALKVYGRLSPQDSMNYEATKKALLERFRFTTEGYREKFRKSKPEEGETARQYAARLQGYFDRWMEVGETPATYEALRDRVLEEQFISQCHARVATFLKERNCQTLASMVETADRFLEAQKLRSLSFLEDDTKTSAFSPSRNHGDQPPPMRPKCFLCGRVGHKAPQCRSGFRHKIPFCTTCQREGHETKSCPRKRQDKPSVMCFVEPPPLQKAMPYNLVEDLNAEQNGYEGEMVNVVQETQATREVENMPVLSGRLNGQVVSVLRDTGSNTVITRRSLIPDSQLTGKMGVVCLVDGTILSLPEAKISLRSPYFTGDLLVKCMEAPLYDVIIGNVEGARGADKPSYEWDTERHQTPGGGKESSKEREDAVPHAGEIAAANRVKATKATPTTSKETRIDIDSTELKRRQKEDDTLEACRTKVGQVQSTKDGSKISFYFSKGVLCRRYEQKGGKSFKQVVVPKTLRTYVLEIAHDSALAGHQGIKRTTDRVLEAFYWPGIQADVKRFVKSCDACQRAAPKGRLKKAPLGRMPIIDTPFERVAMDLIGPLSSTSENGNRYILTMVDFATRYPDAVALPSCDSRTVAEGLLEIFSRVGLPRQILSDRGATFTSGLMQELTQLLSIQKLHTTPYHPMCNGLVERYNGTL